MPTGAIDTPVWTVGARDALANSPIVKAVALSKNPLGYWRLNDLGNVAKDSSGNGHDGTISGYADLILSKGANLVGYWRLEETTGASAADSSGNNRNGAIAGDVALGGAGPLLDPDLAFLFAGAGTGIITGSMPSMTTGSFECWFKSTAISQTINGHLVGMGTGAGPFAFMYRRTTDGLLGFGFTTGTRVFAPSSYADGNWHHAVGTYDGTNLNLYVDGALVAGPITNAGQPFNAGFVIHGFNGIAQAVDASIDEVAIYNVALTPAEVLAHRNAGVVTRPVVRGLASLALGDPSAGAMSFTAAAKGVVHAPVAIGASYSMAAWFNAADLAAQYIVCGSHQGINTTFISVNTDGSIQMRVCNAVTIFGVGTFAGFVLVGHTYHAVATFDGANMRLYLNGALVAGPTAATSVAPDGDFYIAGRGGGFSLNFDGTIDEVAVFNYALSATDVSDLYLAGKTALGTACGAQDIAV